MAERVDKYLQSHPEKLTDPMDILKKDELWEEETQNSLKGNYMPYQVKTDFSKYYWQLSVRNPEWNSGEIWNPFELTWEIYLMCVHQFGNLHAVYDACRLSECLMCIVNVILEIPAIFYIDDMDAFPPRRESLLAKTLVCFFFAMVGLPLNAKCDMHTVTQRHIVMLGISHTICPGDLKLKLHFSLQKVEKVVLAIRTALVAIQDGNLTLRIVQQAVGSIVHMWSIKTQKSAMRPLTWTYGWLSPPEFDRLVKQKKRLRELKCALNLVRIDLTTNPPERFIEINTQGSDPPLHVFTDAADPKKPFIGGCAMISGTIHGFSIKVDKVPLWIKRRSHIGIWEAMGVLMAVISLGPLIRDNRVIFHIDNSGNTFSLSKGTCHCEATAAVMQVIYENLERRNVHPYYAYINTRINPADQLSRLQCKQKIEALVHKLVTDSEDHIPWDPISEAYVILNEKIIMEKTYKGNVTLLGTGGGISVKK